MFKLSLGKRRIKLAILIVQYSIAKIPRFYSFLKIVDDLPRTSKCCNITPTTHVIPYTVWLLLTEFALWLMQWNVTFSQRVPIRGRSMVCVSASLKWARTWQTLGSWRLKGRSRQETVPRQCPVCAPLWDISPSRRRIPSEITFGVLPFRIQQKVKFRKMWSHSRNSLVKFHQSLEYDLWNHILVKIIKKSRR